MNIMGNNRLWDMRVPIGVRIFLSKIVLASSSPHQRIGALANERFYDVGVTGNGRQLQWRESSLRLRFHVSAGRSQNPGNMAMEGTFLGTSSHLYRSGPSVYPLAFQKIHRKWRWEPPKNHRGCILIHHGSIYSFSQACFLFLVVFNRTTGVQTHYTGLQK